MQQNKEIFSRPPEIPTQVTPQGIRYDFNDGLRVLIPENADRDYRVVFSDLASGLIIYAMDVPKGGMVTSNKKYAVPYQLDIYEAGKTDAPLFTHQMDCKGKEVLLELPVGAIGDTIAWFSYAERYQRKHGCRLTVSMAPQMADLFRRQYPEMTFIAPEDAAKRRPYATYRLGLYFGGDTDHQPYDFRKTGLHHTIGYILGLDDEIADEPPRVDLTAPRQIKERYIVVAAKASSQCKMWNNPQGWRETVKALKDRGYRVLCIDRDPEVAVGIICDAMPYGAEDFTGDRPLQERIDLIKDADLFIGLSSGLSWLAWCCKVPVVMISGFTDPINEFQCQRVINTHVCHGCWNDTRCEFDHKDFLWCPWRKDDARFECTRAITSKMVLEAAMAALPASQRRRR